MPLRSKIRYFDIFLIAFVTIILSISVLSFQRINDLIRSSENLNSSHATVLKLEQVFSLIKDVETAQRGYLVTRDSAFLKPYYLALPRINILMQELDSISHNNNSQNKKINELYKLLVLKTTDIKQLNLEKTSRADLIPVLAKGKNLMDSIRVYISDMENDEKNLLLARSHQQNTHASITPAVSLALTFFILLVLIFYFFKMRRDKAEITKNNHDLLEVTTYLEAILNSSSDIILTLDLKLHYSSVNRAGELYLKKSRQQLIGKVPTEFLTAGPKPSEYMAKALAGETNSIESLQTETQPDLKLQVTFIPLLVDEKISGVLILAKDRTSLEKANDLVLETNQLLELKNNELEEANKSLLSFNYIASHDLKEPLRKIQTFGKLLIEEEQGKISENGKYYLERMIHSAARMQALIDALFDYSKAHLNAFHFVATPLNPIINELLEDYKEQLEAINANIECSHLPTIMGAPTLLSQVFSNLLGNAIKYRKPNLPLHIKITSRLLHKIEINQQTIYKDYWQICFRDNGIGFDQVYAEKAFDPFQRLHSKLRHFEGTGIGLTICKKLIQTHKGFIHIVSKENEGTSVYILLPLEMVTREQKQE